ncbi:hypothetical protein ACSFCD_12885, partial [Enterococcus faecalis]
AAFMEHDNPSIKADLSNTLALAKEKKPQVEAAINQATDLIKNDWQTIQTGIHKDANDIRKGQKEVDLG